MRKKLLDLASALPDQRACSLRLKGFEFGAQLCGRHAGQAVAGLSRSITARYSLAIISMRPSAITNSSFSVASADRRSSTSVAAISQFGRVSPTALAFFQNPKRLVEIALSRELAGLVDRIFDVLPALGIPTRLLQEFVVSRVSSKGIGLRFQQLHRLCRFAVLQQLPGG